MPKKKEEFGDEDRHRNSVLRARADSQGSVRGAFSANPMPEPYARRKRREKKRLSEPSSQDNTSNFDFTEMVNQAIIAEGGQGQLNNLTVENKPRKEKKRASEPIIPLKKDDIFSLAVAAEGGLDNLNNFGGKSGKTARRDKKRVSSVPAPQGKPKQNDIFSMAVAAEGGQDMLADLIGKPAGRGSSDARRGWPEVGQSKHLESGNLSTIRDESSLGGDEISMNSSTDNFFGRNAHFDGPSNYGALGKMASTDSLRFSERSSSDNPNELFGPGLLLGKPPNLSHPLTTSGTFESIPEAAHEGPTMKKRRKEKVALSLTFLEYLSAKLDPTPWLLSDMFFDENDLDETRPLFPEDKGIWSVRGVFRVFLFNPEYPEFTSLQQFVWSIIIGAAMGVYTAVWKLFIESCVEFNWVVVPEYLKKVGFFTELDGAFPMTHYMWICPTIFGCVLSYLFASRPNPIPGQNEWIHNVHAKGVQEFDTFWELFFLATAGMASGMSLGPELPLVLTAGMAGSYLGILTKQSVLQARVLNLVAAGSAVGGFFGFPMAGALFVLEIPHRMGLQYFEALSPAIFGSIVAVLVNRMIVNNDVTGYYKYPFLTSTLPSSIFWHAIVFGAFGACIGIGYAKGVLKLKNWVHDIFHSHDHEDGQTEVPNVAKGDDGTHGTFGVPTGEATPLVNGKAVSSTKGSDINFLRSIRGCMDRLSAFSIAYEPKRAAAAGAIAGFLIGIIGMFVPHSMFWGEAQLQNLIDKGRTPLPIFGRGDEPTADLTAWAMCMVDTDEEGELVPGFSLGCTGLIAISKIVVTGLSLGTGIIGGHFWGPLYVGCIASHFFTDLSDIVSNYFGVDLIMGAYPCVAILCTMGATHVVTFRAHTAIMLILTLTISSFNPEHSTIGYVPGDYSAVFPLLVVAVYTSLMISREQIVFYKTQRSRGDIMALPEVLCEPGKEGAPMIVTYDLNIDENMSSNSSGSRGPGSMEGDTIISEGSPADKIFTLDGVRDYVPSLNQDVYMSDTADDAENKITADEIERKFREMSVKPMGNPPHLTMFSSEIAQPAEISQPTATPPPLAVSSASPGADTFGGLSISRLDQLLSQPLENKPLKKPEHRRTKSAAPAFSAIFSPKPSPSSKAAAGGHRRTRTALPSNFSNTEGRDQADADNRLNKITAFGEIKDFQPSLIGQARARASSMHRRLPSASRTPGHSRMGSMDNFAVDTPGPLTIDDVEANFKAMFDQTLHSKQG